MKLVRAIPGIFLASCTAFLLPAHFLNSAGGDVQRTSPHPPATPRLAPPSGPFGVGRIGYDWTDPRRPDRFSANPQAHRELMVYLWYPASHKHADVRGEYLPGAKQMDAEPQIRRRMIEQFGANWPLFVSGAIFSHAEERAPVAENPARFPVIVFSHGLGSTGFNYTSLIEDLASHGYVVAAIEHTESAMAVRFLDGRIIPFHRDSLPEGLTPAERFQRMGASVAIGINEGAADIRFVLDRLTELNAGDAQHVLLAGRLDLNRVGAMGHSAGAEFAARACQLDSRLKACVDLDGGMVPVGALPADPDGATMKPPLLFLEAEHPESQMGGTHADHELYFKKKEEQLQSCPAGTYDVVLTSPGIAHPSFSDIPLLFAGRDGYPETGIVLHNLELIETFVRAFLNANLKGEKTLLLDNPFPEATIRRYGH